MTQVVTIVDLIIPSWVVNSPVVLETMRFISDGADYDVALLPGAIPSIKNVNFTPAIISLGQDLGQRASVEVIFKDHRHVFNGEAFDSGTFWGKFRARYGLKLRGYALTLYRVPLDNGVFGVPEQRNYIIDSTDGPSSKGEYRVIAKDVLKSADGDRSQAPLLDQGFILTDITAVATTLTLSPTGIGSSYATPGLAALGGKEIVSYTRAGDVLTIARGLLNTTAVAHTAGERVQQVLRFLGADPAAIIYQLLIQFGGVSAAYCNLTNWQTEVNTYLNTVYSANIAEPTSVNQLVSELIEQAGLVLWWDDIAQQIRLQVLRAVSTASGTFNGDNTVLGSLEVKEQPDKRLSQVYVYFNKLNPLVADDQIDNYGSSTFATDAVAEDEYGSAAIKKVFSRWIPVGGRSVATSLCNILLTRFATPPRRINLDLLRYSVPTPSPGLGYQIQGWPFQLTDGSADTLDVQLVRLNPREDVYECEFEETFGGALSGGGNSPDNHIILIDGSVNNINLRTIHDSIYTTAVSGQIVHVTIMLGVVVGSSSVDYPALEVGIFASGVTVDITNLGIIQGAGGIGGRGGDNSAAAAAGGSGGIAFYTRQAVTLHNASGHIWGGGGGGGGGGAGFPNGGPGGGGGGGAGTVVGTGGFGGDKSAVFGGTDGGGGNPGTQTTGGTGGAGGTSPASGPVGGVGGTGGASGAAGNAGAASLAAGGAGGSAGAAIDGSSLITLSGAGDILGGQIN